MLNKLKVKDIDFFLRVIGEIKNKKDNDFGINKSINNFGVDFAFQGNVEVLVNGIDMTIQKIHKHFINLLIFLFFPYKTSQLFKYILIND